MPEWNGKNLLCWDGQAYPKVQILTLEQLLADPHRPNPACLQVPGVGGGASVTLLEAPKHKGPKSRQGQLGFDKQEQRCVCLSVCCRTTIHCEGGSSSLWASTQPTN